MVSDTTRANMNAKKLGIEPLPQSSMSREGGPVSGQDVSGGRENTARLIAGWMMLVMGGLLLVNASLASVGAGVSASDWAFVVLAAVASVIAARSLWRDARGAWWMAAAYDAVGLFFVLPVMFAILFSASREPVATGWDVVFFPAVTVALLAMSAALWIVRPKRRVSS